MFLSGLELGQHFGVSSVVKHPVSLELGVAQVVPWD